MDVRVGFVGLGDQGGPIAARIRAEGWPLYLWARREAALLPYVEAGAAVAADLRDLGARCDLVGVCVTADADVRDVVLGPDGIVAGMAPGGIVAIHSTVSPTTVRAVAAEAARHGVDLLDAPVSGGNAGARAGTMTVMIGGSPEAVARARPVFDSFATTVAHLGPVGAGQSMKLLNNTLCYANAAMSVAALEVAEAQGMDLGPVRTIIGKSSGNSVGFSLVGDPTLLAKASGRSSNVRKDVQHFLDTLSANGIEASPLGDVAATAADRLEAWSAHVSARCTDPAATR